MLDSNPDGAASVLLEPSKSTGTATEQSPDKSSAMTRRATLAHLPREARTTIAFLDAEEQMLELRLSRRRGGDSRYPIEARRQFHDKKEAIVGTYERMALANGHGPSRRLTGPTSRH